MHSLRRKVHVYLEHARRRRRSSIQVVPNLLRHFQYSVCCASRSSASLLFSWTQTWNWSYIPLIVFLGRHLATSHPQLFLQSFNVRFRRAVPARQNWWITSHDCRTNFYRVLPNKQIQNQVKWPLSDFLPIDYIFQILQDYLEPRILEIQRLRVRRDTLQELRELRPKNIPAQNHKRIMEPTQMRIFLL